MARINKISITLCALLFTSLTFMPLAHASEQARESTTLNALKAKRSDRKKKAPGNRSKAVTKKTAKNCSGALSHKAASRRPHPESKRSAPGNHNPAMKNATATVIRSDGHKKQFAREQVTPLVLSEPHKARMQKAQKTAINKLMGQLGKPYHWGGASPRTGFDCSGLVYYAYKDLVKFRIPRTANAMYHLRDARPVNRRELQSGDLVFFRTRGRGTADHVGVYVGNGKFIQSPRTGRDIQITSLNEDYWVNHYVGARRVMTAKTIR